VTLAHVALVAATALHLGFQLVVTVLVYPAFREIPVEDWPRYHDAHSRRIAAVVAPVYGALVVASVWVLTVPVEVSTVTAVAASGVAVLTTAVVAAPAHRRLGTRRDEGALAVLLRADLVRSGAALVAAAAALLGAVAN
jgi:hypothetical protein